jgi:hypothetical protein
MRSTAKISLLFIVEISMSMALSWPKPGQVSVSVLNKFIFTKNAGTECNRIVFGLLFAQPNCGFFHKIKLRQPIGRKHFI